MQAAEEEGDRIGMLLDLDQGCMTVWKNDVIKLGVLQSDGLRGPLCWAVEMREEGIQQRAHRVGADPCMLSCLPN